MGWQEEAASRIAELGRPGRRLPASSQPTTRELEVLDRLEALFVQGFAQRTMSDLARDAGCSLRLLYRLAPNREELVLLVIDRALWRSGKLGRAALLRESSPLEGLRSYLGVLTRVMTEWSPEFVTDIDRLESARDVRTAHDQYIVGVAQVMLELARDAGQIAPDADIAAASNLLARLGRLFSQADVLIQLDAGPRVASDAMTQVVLRGLKP
ncbi:MAG: TetR/AcrR family transcriptional regulator [Marmoricola sp.]